MKIKWFRGMEIVVVVWANLVLGAFIAGKGINLSTVGLLAAIAIIDLMIVLRISKVSQSRKSGTLNGFFKWQKLALSGDFQQLERQAGERIARYFEQVLGEYGHPGQASNGSKLEKDTIPHVIQQNTGIQNATRQLEDLIAKSKENLNHANRAGQLAQTSTDTVSSAKGVVVDTVSAMAAIGESSQKINKIISAIDAIAFQTNLLALNAAVEAARAGEQGAGFAVVAQEVRNLAGKAAGEAQTTQRLITDTLHRIENGTDLVRQTQQAFNTLSHQSAEIARVVESIRENNASQGHKFDRLNFGIMKSVAETNRLLNGSATERPTVHTNTPKKYRFRPQWVPQAQFAGYYVAYEKGFFSEAGLAVEMLDGGPDSNPMSELIREEIEFGTTWLSPAVIMASQGADLILLSQIVQQNGLQLVTLKEKGYNTVKELSGKRIGVWGGEFDYPIRTLDIEQGLGLILVQQGFEMKEVIEGKVDAASCMSFNEMFIFDDQGIDRDSLKIFRFQDLGLNFPEDGLYTTRRIWQRDQPACQAFVAAAMKGWRYAADNIAETLQIVMHHARRSPFPTTDKHQSRMLDEILRMIQPGDPGSGTLDHGVFDGVVAALKSINQIDEIPDYRQFYAGVSTGDPAENSAGN